MFREKEGDGHPKAVVGGPKRIIHQDQKCLQEGEIVTSFSSSMSAYEADWLPLCLSEQGDKENWWEMAGHRKGADLSRLQATIWQQKEVSFQWIKCKLQKVAGLELFCCYQKIWLQRETHLTPKHSQDPASRLRGQKWGGGSVGW